MDRINSVLNPNYSRLQDSNMVRTQRPMDKYRFIKYTLKIGGLYDLMAGALPLGISITWALLRT